MLVLPAKTAPDIMHSRALYLAVRCGSCSGVEQVTIAYNCQAAFPTKSIAPNRPVPVSTDVQPHLRDILTK